MTDANQHELAQRMAELARTVAGPRSVDEVLTEVSAEAKDLIPGVDAAGVLLIGKGGRFRSVGGTSDLPQRLDELQMRYHEGPCVEAAVDELIVRSDDLRTERRWPMYSAALSATLAMADVLDVNSSRSVSVDVRTSCGSRSLMAARQRIGDGSSCMRRSILFTRSTPTSAALGMSSKWLVWLW